MGGIGAANFLGFATPVVIVLSIDPSEPSASSHVASVRSGALPVPLPFLPWQPQQVPPASLPRKMLSPSDICAAVGWPLPASCARHGAAALTNEAAVLIAAGRQRSTRGL